MKKIAIIGSAPSSIQLAPYNDPSWQIWACSPGAWPHLKRCDAFFEIHRWEPGKPWFSKEYIAWMATLPLVYTIQPVPEVPNSKHYPLDEVLGFVYAHVVDRKGTWREKRFDRSDFSSTIAWMLALAIAEGADEIGLWGVDMAAQEEWAFQRSGCQSLIDAAKSIGITIRVPCESDLLRPPPLYGFCEIDPAHVKYIARRTEIEARIQNAIAMGTNAQREADAMRGALDQLEYNAKTWVGNPFHLAQNEHHVVDPVVFDVAPVPLPTGYPGPDSAPADDDWRDLESKLGDAGITLVEPRIIPSSTAQELLAALDARPNGALQANSLSD